jgi:hypothetical protein
MNPRAFGSEVDGRQVIAKAKFGESIIPKSIVVSNFAPNIEPFIAFPLLALVHGLEIKRLSSFSHIGSGRYDVPPLKPIFVNFQFLEESIGAEYAINGPSDIAGWQIASVEETYVARIRISCEEKADTARPNTDVSPLENAGIFRLALSGIFSGLPEIPGSPPQRNGGERENGGEQRDNLFVELVKDVPNPSKKSPDISDERAAKGGAVFCIGVILAGIVTDLLAGRK